jgi:hypothetical protein
MPDVAHLGVISAVLVAGLSCSERPLVRLPASPLFDEYGRSAWREGRVPSDVILDVSADLKRSRCALHGEALRPAVVPIRYGLVGYDPDYIRALDALFPWALGAFAGGCVPGEHTHARVMYCSRCRKAKAAWIAHRRAVRERGDRGLTF